MVWIAAAIVLVLFILFPKKMFGIAGVLVAIGGVIVGYYYYDDWKNDKEKAAVAVMIEYSPEKCKEPYPLKVIIGNASSRIVSNVEWDISVKELGFSSDLAESSYHEYSEDKILKPKEGWGICARVPNLKRTVKDLLICTQS